MYDRQMWFESPVQPAVTHQLGGLGSANQLAVDMPDQTVRMFYGITADLGAALSAGGKPQRPYNFGQYNVQGPTWGLAPNGYYSVSQFMGGFLLDGCPLNVIFGQGWQAGQQAALQQAGIVPQCPQMMTAPAPTTTAQAVTAPPQSATFQPTNAPLFTTSLTRGGIVTGPSPAAPQTTVFSNQAPPAPTDVFQTSGTTPEAPAALPSWLPIAAAVLIAVLLRKRGN